MVSKKFFFVIAVIALMSGMAFAQGSAKISGTVKDSNGAVVNGATVTALNIASSQRVTATTDGNGKYEFTGLRGGSYRVVATSQGFGESAETILIDEGGSTNQDFSISPGGIKDVVTVTAGKGSDRLAVETPQTVTVTSSEQIEQRLPRSTFETMERSPNISAIESNPARERPRLRGLASNRLLVLIDGEKLNNARTDIGASGQPIQVVDPSQLESVEVVAGSGSSLYGSDSIGGTINLITKRPELSPNGVRLGLRFDGNYNSNGKVGRGNATMNLSSSNVAFRASFNKFRNGNYHVGNGGVTIAENIEYGKFFITIPRDLSGTTNVLNRARDWAVYSIPNGGEITNGDGNGEGKNLDLWFFPTSKHNFRGKYLNRVDNALGDAGSGPPYETQERFSSFRSFTKYGIRYEGLDLAKVLPRVSVNFYEQKYSFPQNQFTYVIANSTQVTNPSFTNDTTFTGNPSIFLANGGSFTDNRNSIVTDGIDLQATLLPFTGLVVTVGGGRTTDTSRDYFFTSPLLGTTASPRFYPSREFTGTPTIGASSPVTKYTDNNFYAQAEFDKVKWFRLSGGIRYDNWVTLAIPGNGFPLSTELSALNAALPVFTTDPGTLSSLVPALPGLIALAGGTGTSGSNRKSYTSNFGIVGRLPFGINPYFRYANSYREAGITEKFLIRNFTPGLPGLASLVVGNPTLLPETGKNYEAGVKIQQKYFNLSFGYFQNKINDLLAFASKSNCVAPVPGVPAGFASAPCLPTQVNVQINARTNQGKAEISGFESTGEAALSLGSFGSLNPFYTLGTLHGRTVNPTAVQLAALNTVYNKPNALGIELTGSAEDFPLGTITPLRLITGVQYLDTKGRIYAEYNWRHQNKVTRVLPNQLTGTALVNYGSFKSLSKIDKHSIKGGYNWKTDNYKFSLNAGIDNLTDAYFFEQFNNSPAPGRSFVFGMTIELFNLLKK